MVKNEHRNLIFEWIDQSTWHVACLYIFKKAKVILIVIGRTWSNIGVAFKVIGTLLHLKNEWMNRADFLHAHNCEESQKSQGYMHRVKYGSGLLGPGILKSALSQE